MKKRHCSKGAAAGKNKKDHQIKKLKWILAGLIIMMGMQNASASCTSLQLKILNISSIQYDQFLKSNVTPNAFQCYEIKYLINTGQIQLSESEYETELRQKMNQSFPNDTTRLSMLRQIGTPTDITELKKAAIEYKTGGNTIASAQKSLKNIALFSHAISMQNGTLVNRQSVNTSPCMPPQIMNQIYADFPLLQRPMVVNEGQGVFLDNTLRPNGIVRINGRPSTGNYNQATIQMNQVKYQVGWHKNCSTIEKSILNANAAGAVSQTIVRVLFTQMAEAIKHTYKAFSDMGRYLLGLLLVFWIVLYIAKRYVRLDLTSDFSAPQMINVFFKLLIFVFIYTTLILGDSPKHIVDIFIAPVLEIGVMIGQEVLKVSGGSDIQTLMEINNPDSILGSVEHYIIYLIEEVERLNMNMVMAGFMMFGMGFKGFIAGLVIIVLFLWLTLKYLYIIFEVFFKLFLILFLLPFLGLAWVFKLTRPYANKGINYLKNAVLTCAYLPLLVIFQSFLMMSFLSGGSAGHMDALRSGIETKNPILIYQGLNLESFTFWEAIFIAVLMIYMIDTVQEYIRSFTDHEFETSIGNRIDSTLKNWKKQAVNSTPYKNTKKKIIAQRKRLGRNIETNAKSLGKKTKNWASRTMKSWSKNP